MKKLLFVIPTLETGGAERVLVNLVNTIDSNRYSITVLTILNGGGFRKDISEKIKVLSLIKMKNLVLRKIIYYFLSFIIPGYFIDRVLIKENYDYKIAYLSGLPAKIVLYSKNPNTKTIAFIHTDFSTNYLLHKYYKNQKICLDAHRKFNRVVFVSNQAKRGFEKSIGILDNAIVIQNINDIERIKFLASELMIKRKSKDVLFVSVGRLDTVKGYDRLIDSVIQLNQNNYSFEVWIIGDGSERENLSKKILSSSVRNVKLIGHKSNPYPYILVSDLFICSSRAEGFSTVVSEAIILHKPVITTDCAGMDDILDNGKFGMIVPNSTIGIYEGMKKILENQKLIDFYSQKAHERSEYFSTEKILEKYYELFG